MNHLVFKANPYCLYSKEEINIDIFSVVLQVKSEKGKKIQGRETVPKDLDSKENSKEEVIFFVYLQY